MNRIVLLFFVMIYTQLCIAQLQPDFKPLRYNDDFSFISKDSIKNWYRSAKHLPLVGDRHYVSFGGEIRFQYINTVNNKWGDESDNPDGYLLSRYLLHADIHSGIFRAFVQLQSSLANSLPNPSPVDDNTIDVHQAFVDAALFKDSLSTFTLRAGRQELLYGSQRLIGVREGPNSRIAMDGAKLFYSNAGFRSDLFYVHPVANIKGAFNDRFNEDARLWGSYTTLNGLNILHNLDFYYIGLWKNNAEFDSAIGKEQRHSIGFRLWKNKGLWLYDIEALYQFGQLDVQDISAWTVSSNISYKAENILFKPVFGLKTEAISGDKNSSDNKLQTFNPLYPRGAYFGLVALIGPANLFDVHPSVNLELNNKWVLGFDYDMFWRWSSNDGLYAPNMQLLYSAEGTTENFIGTQLSSSIEYTPNGYLSFTLEGAWFDSGAFLKEAGTGKDYFYGALTARLRF